MTGRTLPDRDTLLMMLSAYLDGELPASDEALVLDALSQDPELLVAFEAMTAAMTEALRLPELSRAEADDVTAGVLAATHPSEVPETVAGALELASLSIDDCLDDRGTARLQLLLESTQEPALAPAIAGFVASVDAVRATTRAPGTAPSVLASLRHVADHVDAIVSADLADLAARERAFVLASGALDDELAPAEWAELQAAYAVDRGDLVDVAGFAHLGEGLRAASSSPAFLPYAQRAGAAALQALAAVALQSATASSGAPAKAAGTRAVVVTEPLWARVWRAVSSARTPLGFAMAAGALFFVLSGPAPVVAVANAPDRDAGRRALMTALAATPALTDAPVTGDLPLLADNSADVEALDATDTTVVFSTEGSNITVIWVDAEEQG